MNCRDAVEPSNIRESKPRHLGGFGKKQVALNVIERGRAWHWRKLPKGWFDLAFCLEHGQRQTRQTLRELFMKIARPYLRHRRKYQPSRHISGLQVVSLPDLLFAKVSAFSTRGFTRDLIDLLAVDQQKNVDWPRLLLQASCATDNDYNPAEFHRKLQQHLAACGKPDYWQEAPVTHPPTTAELRGFVQNLLAANRQVARTTLE